MLPSIFTSSNNQGFFPTMFSDFFNDNWLMPQFHSTSPAINVSEDDKEYKLELAAPGMTKDDFKISIANDDIVISMEKKTSNDAADAQDKTNKKYLRREFSYTKSEQRLALPDNVDRKHITAQMTDGVLNINIPKLSPEQQVQECQCIEIK